MFSLERPVSVFSLERPVFSLERPVSVFSLERPVFSLERPVSGLLQRGQ